MDKIRSTLDAPLIQFYILTIFLENLISCRDTNVDGRALIDIITAKNINKNIFYFMEK